MAIRYLTLAALLGCRTMALAEDKKGTEVTVSGLKATTPAEWKSEEPTSNLRKAQFKLPKEKGDSEDAELVLFVLAGGGDVDANLKRQPNTFKIPEGVKKEDAIKVEDFKVGDFEAKYQTISGTYQFKAAPFDPNAKVTEKEKFRQLYVIFVDSDKATISFRLVGPEKTVDKHKKDFDAFLKAFKK